MNRGLSKTSSYTVLLRTGNMSGKHICLKSSKGHGTYTVEHLSTVRVCDQYSYLGWLLPDDPDGTIVTEQTNGA